MSTRKRSRRRSADDFEREIRSHIELETDRLIEDGMSPEAARRAARQKFGNVTMAKERFYETGRLLWLDRLMLDIRGAVRSIRRYPVAATVAVMSLAAGIGATTVTLAVRDTVFHKAPPLYLHPEQLSRIQVGGPDRPIRPIGSHVPGALYTIWRDGLGSTIAAATPPRGMREARADDRADLVPVRAATPEFFSLLGIRPHLGLPFSSDAGAESAAGHPASPPSAWLSHRVWQRLFDGRPDVVGRVVWIEDQPYTVVGVLPERFWFSEMNAPIWTILDPRTLAPDEALEVIVRRPREVTPAMLDAQLQGGLLEYARRLPAAQQPLRLKVSGIEGTPLGRQVALALPYVLGTSVLLTLLIACANVAMMMIAQWTAREHEIAIRASIGASRGRIVRSLLTESVLVAVCGGALGVCATFALRGWIVRRGGADLPLFDPTIEPRVLVQTALITFFAGIAAGIAPALFETRRLHANPLRTIATADRIRQRWRHALVVFEIAVTVALLVVTVAMIDGYQRARRAQMGFPTRSLLSMRVENPAGVQAARILDLLNQLPGVAAAAASTTVPFAVTGPQAHIGLDAAGSNAVPAERGAISPRFFSALGVPLRAGRPFSDQDSAAARVAVVNEALAKRLFPKGDPVGRRIWIAQIPHDIVGVAANYSNNPLRPPDLDAKVFLPLPEKSENVERLHVVIRADGDPAPLIAAIRPAVRDTAPGTVVTSAYTFDQIISVMGQELLLGTAPLFPLIAIGMLLTAAGIYGVLAFAITRRSRELAVRVAIGASGRDVVRLVAAHSARLVTTGSLLGVAVTFGLARLVRAAGGAGSIFDPPMHAFLLPLILVLAIGALATWVPSRRALRIDPAVVLRTT